MDNQSHNIDEMFDRLEELYRSDPEAFEAMRKLLIEQTIERFPVEHRARAYGLQFRIDAELRHYRDPIARMNRMVEIFWEGVRRFQETIADPARVLHCRQEEKADCKVIPFPDKTLH